MEHNIIIQVSVLVGVILGGSMGLYYLKSHITSPKYLRNHVKEIELLYYDAKKEIKRLKGSSAQLMQVPTIAGEFDLSNAEGVGNFVREYAPALKKFVPKQYQHLLDNKGLVDLALNVYKQNPEKAQQFLSKFIKQPSKKGEPVSAQGIEGFDPASAL